jgi:hypothetical protein
MPTENDPKNIRNNIKKSTWLRQTIFLCEITFLAAINGEKGEAEKGGNSLLQWSNNHWANCPTPPPPPLFLLERDKKESVPNCNFLQGGSSIVLFALVIKL